MVEVNSETDFVGRSEAFRKFAHEIALQIAASGDYAEAERAEMSRIASMEAKRLEQLASGFLSYAKPGSCAFQPVDLSVLTAYILSVVQAQAANKRLQFQTAIEEHCTLMGDEGQLQQALLNLLLNAVQASPEHGTVFTGLQKRQDGVLRVTIENGGAAIPEALEAHIFEPFVSAKNEGAGLGLAIAKNIVARHGGELNLERNEPGRIVFTAELPAHAGAEQSAGTAQFTERK
jgi:signal transduction histidine kinase